MTQQTYLTGARELVEVWRKADGTWRWRYRNGDGSTEILSSQAFPSLEDSLRSATQAYPGVAVVGREAAPRRRVSPGGRPGTAGLVLLVVAAAATTFLALAAWLWWRRVRRTFSAR